MDKFTKEEQIAILEIARLALGDSVFYDELADSTDLSDEWLKNLQEKLRKHMSGEST